MSRPILHSGKSLSERVRAYAPDVTNDIIAAELGANPRTVAVVRAKQKRPTAYRAKARSAQRKRRSRTKADRDVSWAAAWADTFKSMGQVTAN